MSKRYVQGDVVLKAIDDFPEGERVKDDQTKNKILAFGEATGHRHQIMTEDGVEVFRILNKLYINASKPFSLRHGKAAEVIKQYGTKEPGSHRHLDIEVPPGKYESDIARETDHLSKVVRRVVD